MYCDCLGSVMQTRVVQGVGVGAYEVKVVEEGRAEKLGLQFVLLALSEGKEG